MHTTGFIKRRQVYRRTPAGDRALQSLRSVPKWFRDILAQVSRPATTTAICNSTPSDSEEQVLGWIDQLETLGLIELVISSADLPEAVPMVQDISEAERDEVPFLPAEAVMAIKSSSPRL